MNDFKIILLIIFTVFSLSTTIEVSYSQTPSISNPSSNFSSLPATTTTETNNVITPTNPFLNNSGSSQLLGNLQNLPLNPSSNFSSLPATTTTETNNVITPTNPFLNNSGSSQLLGNLQNLPLNPSSNFSSLPATTTTETNNVITPTNPFLNNSGSSQLLGNLQNLPLNPSSNFSSLPATTTTETNNVITPTNPFLNNSGSSQLLGNLQNLPLNKSLANYTHINKIGILSQNTKNDSVLSDLYNLTANSVVDVTAFNRNNHSQFKTGSGFVYEYNGKSYIITVSNLVVGKNDITVTLSDGSSYDDSLTGYDPLTTLAVLSTKNIPQNKLTPLHLSNTTNLKVGQAVTAIGNTMGFSNLLTTGIISGLGKSIPTFGQNISGTNAKIPNGIITTLNVDSGYGGSPLLYINGQVIGMNIGNFSSTTNQLKNTGFSFAVPSNSISKIIPSLLSKGYYSHPWLGAFGVDVNLDIARAIHLNETKGFMVIAVANSSPSKKAGILGGDNTTTINGRKITLGGDVILKVDNKNIQNIQDMSGYIENKKNIGDDMLVTLLRNGIIQLIHVRLEANPNYFLPLK